MKYFRPLLAVVLLATTISLFVFVTLASAATPTVHRCISHWHVVSSATIYHGVDSTQQTNTTYSVGTVSLLRDGCGNIRAKLHPTVVSTSMYVYLTGAKSVTIGVDATGTGSADVITAIYHHYGKVAVSATGTITQVSGDSPVISVARTAPNFGK